MDILQKIIADQRSILVEKKKQKPLESLQETYHYTQPCRSLMKTVLVNNDPVIIAEFKRKSPSKPSINVDADIHEVVTAYDLNGASAISVLTNETFFGGSNEDIITARSCTDRPILRKEFIIDDYQIHEAKSLGADIVLLIAEALEPEQCAHLSAVAKSLGMEVLMELHSEGQLHKCNDAVDFIGVNNRNLMNFNTDIETSIRMVDLLPPNKIWISESGIHSAYDAYAVCKVGYRGLLIGEQFMASHQPGQACGHFLQSLKSMLHED